MDINFNLKVLSFKWTISINRRWVQFGIIALTLLLSLVIAYWSSQQTLTLTIVLLGGIGIILVLLQYPNLGFILIFLSGIFIKFTGPSNTNVVVAVIGLMWVLWILDMFVVKRRFEFVNSRALLPVFIFIGVSVVSFGMGQIPWFIFANQAPLTAQAGGFAIFVLSAGALILAAHLIRDEQWLKIIVWTFINLGAIYIIARLLKISAIDRFYHIGFTAGAMFWTWLVVLALSQAIFNNQLKVRARIFLIVLVILTMYVAFVQANDWKSGWVPPLVGIAVIMGIRFKKSVIFVIPVAILLVVYMTSKLIGSDEYSWGTRVDAWTIVLEISRVSPFLGMGFSNYYWYTPLFPIRGWNVSFNSHSQYVDLIAQVGLVGLFCFLWIFLEIGRLGWRLANRLENGFVRSYAYGVLAGAVASLMAAFLVDWILPFVYNIGFNGFRSSIVMWIFFGGLIGLEQLYQVTQQHA